MKQNPLIKIRTADWHTIRSTLPEFVSLDSFEVIISSENMYSSNIPNDARGGRWRTYYPGLKAEGHAAKTLLFDPWIVFHGMQPIATLWLRDTTFQQHAEPLAQSVGKVLGVDTANVTALNERLAEFQSDKYEHWMEHHKDSV